MFTPHNRGLLRHLTQNHRLGCGARPADPQQDVQGPVIALHFFSFLPSSIFSKFKFSLQL